MPIPITGFYTGLSIIIAIVLGIRIGFFRARKGISILDGGDMEVATRMRAHGNFTETAALILFALGVLELNGTPAIILHILGILYITARILHPIGLKHDNIRHPLRTIGAMTTTLVMVTAGGLALWKSSLFLLEF